MLPVIRRNPARAARLRASGLAPVELGFGGALDLLTRPRLRAALRGFGPRVVVSWMNRASGLTPRGDWVLAGPARRLLRPAPLPPLRPPDRQHARHRRLAARERLAGGAHATTCPTSSTISPRPRPPPTCRRAARCCSALGRLHTDKGFDTAIRALARLPGAQLAIAGDGPEETALRRLAAQSAWRRGCTFSAGAHDAGALLRAADLFVCASRIEPLGNMVIEAWSAGCPLVAVAAAGPRELVRDGEDGRVVPLEDPTALAAAIGALLSDRAAAAAMARAGRLRFETEFSRAPVLAAWRQFLAGVGG